MNRHNRRCEVFVCGEWKPISFNKLRKGHLFRLFDWHETDGKTICGKIGVWLPDRYKRGRHVVNFALEDAKPMKIPMRGVIKCEEVRGF
jgi:hypothetical protein